MECLVVSKAALISESPRVLVRPPSYLIRPNRTALGQRRTKPKISLSLDALIAERPVSPASPVRAKKRRKVRKSHSTPRSNQPDRRNVSDDTINRTDLLKSRKPPIQPIEFSPDRIIRKAISKMMCRSATLPLNTPTTSQVSNDRSIKIATSLLPYTAGHKSRQQIVSHQTKIKKVFLSDTHNPGVIGVSAGRIPPLNTPIQVSHSIELVPSLGDARSQVSLQKELRHLESQRLAISLAETERIRAENEKRAGEDRIRAKSQFRAEVYALNKVMRQLEEDKFNESLSAKV